MKSGGIIFIGICILVYGYLFYDYTIDGYVNLALMQNRNYIMFGGAAVLVYGIYLLRTEGNGKVESKDSEVV